MATTLELLRKFLKEKAANRECVYYTEVFHHFQIPKSKRTSGENPIPQFLGRMMREDAKANLPLLASVVVAKKLDTDKSKLLPSQAYFDALGAVREMPIPKGREKRLRYQAELKAVFDHYGG